MTQCLCFDVEPGQVYELHFVLQERNRKLGTAAFSFEFCDVDGRPVDVRIIRGPAVVPDVDPLLVELLPLSDLDADGLVARPVQRFILTPPDAITLRLTALSDNVAIDRLDIQSVDIDLLVADPVRVLKELEEKAAQKNIWLADHCNEADVPDLDWAALFNTSARQYAALVEWFAPSGDWSPVLNRLRDGVDLADFKLRMSRLSGQADKKLPRIGFIGSARGRERLEGFAQLLWLRQDRLDEQLAVTRFDAVVIESSLASGVEGAEWALSFSSLNGSLPEAGRRVFDTAALNGVPVHLWMTGDPAVAPLWQESVRRADKVIVEGDGWLDIDADACVPLATEPAACSLAALSKRSDHLMLVPVAADILQHSEFAAFVSGSSLYQPLFTDFRYALNRNGLRERLGQTKALLLSETARAEQRALLQATTIVLLSADSPRSDAELAQMAMDAIACGAIPVLYGAPRSDDTLLATIDCVTTRSELMTLQGLYQIRWVHERRWRGLMAQVMAHHVWTSADRAAVLGSDAMPADFDTPKVSVVLVTKRPHFLQRCFETFRRQSWTNAELILVFNAQDFPKDIPDLRDNERIFTLPEAASLGECLNRGIEVSTGQYWCKMDDDDYYSSRYLGETVMCYRSTQADIVGRQSGYFYFDGKGDTISRDVVGRRNYAMLEAGESISGATLSATTGWTGDLFSSRHRSQADADWVSRVNQKDNRIFSAGFTEMVVYRDALDESHTWRMGASVDTGDRYQTRANYNMFDVFERIE